MKTAVSPASSASSVSSVVTPVDFDFFEEKAKSSAQLDVVELVYMEGSSLSPK